METQGQSNHAEPGNSMPASGTGRDSLTDEVSSVEASPVDLRIPRLRLLLILLAVVASVLMANRHVESVGRHAEYRMDDFRGRTVTTGDIQVSPEGIVRVEGVHVEADGTPVVTFEAMGLGDGMGIVSLPDEGMGFPVSVKPDGVVVTGGADFSGWESVGWGFVTCFAVATLVFGWNTAWLWRRSWYGYEMLAYLGATAFCACQAVEFAQVMASGQAHAFSDLMMLIVTISERFALMTMPIALTVAVLIGVSNAELIRHEGRGARNLLGVALSLALVAFLVGWRVILGIASSSSTSILVELGTNSVVSTIGAFGLTMFLATCVCSWLAARHRPSMPKDYVMVLGCGLRPDGSLTPLLASRVDEAMRFAKGQRDAGISLPKLVPSGGQGDDEIVAEGEAMRAYAVDAGYPEGSILVEGKSTNTRENFACARRIIATDMTEAGRDGEAPSVAFSTTNYHVFRSYVYAHQAGMAAEGIAAPTKWYFWPNAFLREFVGLIAGRPVAILLALVVIIALYGMAEYVIILG